MCGIAGFYGKGTADDGRSMIDRIRYRGPDYQQVIFSANVCLAHARLSIIDLSENANQPMYSKDRKLCIVFNGEIYNFLSLKEELIKKGITDFATSSDTEVLLLLYREYGNAMLHKINGMFAFAIHDFEKNEMFLARDRMGKKPLYYTQADNTFVFGSEIKSVLCHPSVQKQINPDSLNRYLTFDYIPGKESIYSNVLKLEPAHYLIVKDCIVTEDRCYWEYNYADSGYSFREAVERFDTLMNDAVKRRMISDVPLGVFLSGGIDSSTVAYYAQKNATGKIKTFSIGFEDQSYDEQDYAKMVAEKIGSEHSVSVLTAQTTLGLIDKIFPLLDEPFADASLIPTFFLSAFTRQHVTVALGGDGSDELLAGYPTFISEKFRKPIQLLPKPAIDFLLSMAQLIPVSDKNISHDFKIKQFLRGFLSSKNHVHQLWLGSFIPDEKSKLLNNTFRQSITDPSGLSLIDFYYNQAPTGNEFNKTAYYYCKTYLPDDILFKVDRASMYNSLEVRAPFLDVNVVEFLNSLPANYKQKRLNGKYILKKMMQDFLPEQIINRPKKGFGIPLSEWIRKDLKKNIEDCLLSSNEFFNREYIEQLLKEHHSRKANHRKLIWNLYVFLYWYQHTFKQI